MKFQLTFLFVLFSFSMSLAQVYEEYLLSGWTFKAASSTNWLPAEVPGSVKSDLILNGRTQQERLKGEWEYNTSFTVDDHILVRDHIGLLFQGLDTQADVYLNDQLILQADNMFRTWEVPVKSILKKGSNNLKITFKSPNYIIDPSLRKASYHFEGNIDSLGIPIGILKPVILQSWNTYKLVNAFVDQVQLIDKEALMNAVIDVKGRPNSNLEIEIYNEITNKTYKKQRVILQDEMQEFQIPFTIRNPKRWWPVSMGKQDLYVIGVRIKSGNNEQVITKRIGLREVEILSSNHEDSLSVKVNGKTLVLQGINYKPTKKMIGNQMHSDDYNSIFEKVLGGKFNTIHVLGSGIYENDYFYDLADIKGILIIQDFMFTKMDYPTSTKFLENVRLEVGENINHLKQHPSLILWTGGFRSNQSVHNDNLKKVLEETVKKRDSFHPYVDYQPTNNWSKF